MTATITERALRLWHRWWTRGAAPRTLPGTPEQADTALRVIYGLWLAGLTLKLVGSTWDVSWHFRWLRDDLAPPHLINTVGTVLVVALTLFHSYTGYGVDRAALRLMQSGVAVFLLAIPADVINHRVYGLDITAWSVTHALLYLGTLLMLCGVLRGWSRLGTGRWQLPGLLLGWAFILEAVWFPAQQQEYGVLAVAAWDRGAPDAEPILLQFAADELGRAVDRAAVLHFALPVPPWLYPFWLVAAAGAVLVLARAATGFRWAATTVAAGYVLYRCVAWGLLTGAGFPPSAVPFVLVAVAVAVDLAFLAARRETLRPLVGTLLVGVGAAGAALLQHEQLVLPPSTFTGLVAGMGVLALLWTAVVLTRWSLARRVPVPR